MMSYYVNILNFKSKQKMSAINIALFFILVNLGLVSLIFYLRMQDERFNMVFNSEFENLSDKLSEYHESMMGRMGMIKEFRQEL